MLEEEDSVVLEVDEGLLVDLAGLLIEAVVCFGGGSADLASNVTPRKMKRIEGFGVERLEV